MAVLLILRPCVAVAFVFLCTSLLSQVYGYTGYHLFVRFNWRTTKASWSEVELSCNETSKRTGGAAGHAPGQHPLLTGENRSHSIDFHIGSVFHPSVLFLRYHVLRQRHNTMIAFYLAYFYRRDCYRCSCCLLLQLFPAIATLACHCRCRMQDGSKHIGKASIRMILLRQ